MKLKLDKGFIFYFQLVLISCFTKSVALSDVVRLPLGKDLQSIINEQDKGTSFLLETGIHRGYEINLKAGDTLVGEEGAILSGAELLTGWKYEDPYWVHEGPHSKIIPPLDDETRVWEVRANYPHDLFCNDVPLIQRMSRSLYLLEGKYWFYDYEEDKIYIGFDPSSFELELSGLCRYGLKAMGRGVTLRNVRFENYSTYDLDPAVDMGPGALVEGCTVSGSHCIGIRISSNSTIRGSAFNYNGLAGLHNGGDATLIELCEFGHNGWAGFSGDWARGGCKVPGVTNTVLRRNYAHHNTGPGFWFDINANGNLFEENLSEFNSWEGLIYELSCGCEIRNNILRWNGLDPRGGLLWGVPFVIQNAENANIHHNYFEASPAKGARGGGVSIINQFRPQYTNGICGEHTAEGNHIHNNVIVMPNGGYNGLQYGSFGWGTYNDFLKAGNLWEKNTYLSGKPTRGNFHWYGPGKEEEDFVIEFLNWNEWRNRAQDTDSILIGKHSSFFNPFNPELDDFIRKTTGVSYQEIKDPFTQLVFDDENDSDNDGLPDAWEKSNGLDWTLEDASMDTDSDGLENIVEYQSSTNPQKPDTDGDGIPDGWELDHGINPLFEDSLLDPDEDSFTNLEEYELNTDPIVADQLKPSVPEEGLTMWLKSGAPMNTEYVGTVSSWQDWRQKKNRMDTPFNHDSPVINNETHNGYPLIDFSSGDLKSSENDVLGNASDGWTLFNVFRVKKIDEGSAKFALMGNSVWRKSGFRLTLEQGHLHFYSTQSEDPVSVVAHRRLIDQELVVITLYYDAINREGRLYLDGIEQERAKGHIPFNSEPLWIGHIGGMQSQPAEHAELLTYNRPLGHAERKAVEAMLLGKYKSMGLLVNDSDNDGISDWWEMEYGAIEIAQEDADSDGLSNLEEYLNRTNPYVLDTDGDGLTDVWELSNEWNPRLDDSAVDIDSDGLDSVKEMQLKTDPERADSDGDLMNDGWEFINGLDPLFDDADEDPDKDKLKNLDEFLNNTLAQNADSDMDSLSDYWEIINGWDPLNNAIENDSDDDGLTDFEEFRYQTDIASVDTDNDKITDWDEINNNLNPLVNDADQDPDSDGLNNLSEIDLGTDPFLKDTDSDGMPDGWESKNRMNALTDDALEDFDFDSISNLSEYVNGTDPIEWIDIDEDGMHDLWEIQLGLKVNVVDGDEDPDKDNVSNLIEFILGGDPYDNKAAPGLGVQETDSKVTGIWYNVLKSRHYFYKINLERLNPDNSWEELLNFDQAIKDLDLSSKILDRLHDKAVYRIRMERLP
ncbi:MAG: right-handed parallel beta-helix repeat-containing protein [Verrucomicrobiales bacterium]|nr:MAG: right-handed parallel beta-helix repeat-containing protein [Verrucomicrobiaceae bacterium]